MNLVLTISTILKIVLYLIILYNTVRYKDKGWTIVATMLILINIFNIFFVGFSVAFSGISAAVLAFQIIKTVRKEKTNAPPF